MKHACAVVCKREKKMFFMSSIHVNKAPCLSNNAVNSSRIIHLLACITSKRERERERERCRIWARHVGCFAPPSLAGL